MDKQRLYHLHTLRSLHEIGRLLNEDMLPPLRTFVDLGHLVSKLPERSIHPKRLPQQKPRLGPI